MKKILAYVAMTAFVLVGVLYTSTTTVSAAGLPSLIKLPALTSLTNKDQCKNGGWDTFFNPMFKNQGLCVAYSNYLNRTSVQNVTWNLSAAVMPAPPYGSVDELGSDTASNLVVTHIIGTDPTLINGQMAGLTPNSTYTVYISKSYVPYVNTGWDTSGTWGFSFEYLGGYYAHSVSLAQSGSSITGSGSSAPYSWVIDSGSVSGSSVSFIAHYTATADATSPLTVMNVTGIIASNGTMSGTWTDNYQGGARSGTWSTTSGVAVMTHTGDTTWPGLLTSTVQPFTFTTDNLGMGSWSKTLTSYDVTLPTVFSVWINSAAPGTMLISNNVSLN